MEYAIIEISGTQAWVQEGQHIITNSLSTEPGKSVLFKRVLLVNKDNKVSIGRPYLENNHVIGKVVEHLRGTKITVYKMKSKKKYRRKMGHRQEKTKILINQI